VALISSASTRSMIFTFSAGSILFFLDIEIPPSRFYISMSYLGVAYQILRSFFILTEFDHGFSEEDIKYPTGFMV
ncbi:MAG: hypothetical protein IKP88_16425, partial [Lachnospiraceae bacterium]|nr:hypothetical protein [Lachnospiraceae bacterium]